jgi:alkylation response protein AidB-like acyl-CoA dehydrogenase
MTITNTTSPAVDAAGVLDAADALGPSIAERAAEIEAARRLPAGLLDQLDDAGCFGILLPRTHGGLEADLPSALRVFERLAVADGSVGWTVMIGAVAWCDVAALPPSSFDSLYASGRRTIFAGAFNPMGASITPAEGGYHVTGRWGFASGCEHADWFFGNAVEGFADGHPRLRMSVFSPDQVTLEDTWHVSGMCGTGSHHFSVTDVFVPAERTFVPLVDPPRVDTPIVQLPPPPLISISIASVALGIAEGALEDVLALASTKVPLLAPGPLASNGLFHRDVAAADTEVRAARALRDEVAAELWEVAVARGSLSLEQRARSRAAAVWIVERAIDAVDLAYRSGGGTSLYLDSPLQRRLRDVHALSQHFLVKPDTLTTAGAILAGQDVEVMVF